MQSKKSDVSNESATVRHTAIYARTAAVQHDYSALEAQVESCVRQAAEDGVPAVAAAHVFRDHGSGLDLDRAGLNQLRRAVQAGDMGVVYVHSPARLSRSRTHFVLLYEEFAAAGVEIRFVRGSFDNNLLGRLFSLVDSGVGGNAYGKAEMPTTSHDRWAGTVRSMFELSREGWSTGDIAVYLNEMEPPIERGG